VENAAVHLRMKSATSIVYSQPAPRLSVNEAGRCSYDTSGCERSAIRPAPRFETPDARDRPPYCNSAKIMRPAAVCNTFVTVALTVWLMYRRPCSTTTIVPSSR